MSDKLLHQAQSSHDQIMKDMLAKIDVPVIDHIALEMASKRRYLKNSMPEHFTANYVNVGVVLGLLFTSLIWMIAGSVWVAALVVGASYVLLHKRMLWLMDRYYFLAKTPKFKRLMTEAAQGLYASNVKESGYDERFLKPILLRYFTNGQITGLEFWNIVVEMGYAYRSEFHDSKMDINEVDEWFQNGSADEFLSAIDSFKAVPGESSAIQMTRSHHAGQPGQCPSEVTISKPPHGPHAKDSPVSSAPEVDPEASRESSGGLAEVINDVVEVSGSKQSETGLEPDSMSSDELDSESINKTEAPEPSSDFSVDQAVKEEVLSHDDPGALVEAPRDKPAPQSKEEVSGTVAEHSESSQGEIVTEEIEEPLDVDFDAVDYDPEDEAFGIDDFANGFDAPEFEGEDAGAGDDTDIYDALSAEVVADENK